MKTKIPILQPRNWVAKNDRNRAQRHRVRTQYQRHQKHRASGPEHINFVKVDQ